MHDAIHPGFGSTWWRGHKEPGQQCLKQVSRQSSWPVQAESLCVVRAVLVPWSWQLAQFEVSLVHESRLLPLGQHQQHTASGSAFPAAGFVLRQIEAGLYCPGAAL